MVSIVFLAVFLPLTHPVKAVFVYGLADSCTGTRNGSYTLKTEHPSGNTSSSANGQDFTSGGSNYRLGYVDIYLSKTASPTANLTCALYNSTGSVPTGSPVAYSDNIVNSSTLPVHLSYSWVMFNFSAQVITIKANSYYSLIVEVNSTHVDGTDYVRVGQITGGGAHTGNNAYYKNSAWGAGASDVMFRLYNLTVSDATNPLYRNADSEHSTIEEGDSNELYAEGYDESGLDMAWLATNETGGTWKNYTETYRSIADVDEISKFQVPLANNPTQGLAVNDTHVWWTNNSVIHLYTRAGNEVLNHTNANADGTDMSQVNGIEWNGDPNYPDYLWVSSHNNTPHEESYIKIYNRDTLAYIEEHEVGNSQWRSEDVTWFNGSWWVTYHSYNYTRRFNTTWHYQEEYLLSYPNVVGYNWQMYQSGKFNGNFFYCNRHASSATDTLDVYHWNGSGLDTVMRVLPANRSDGDSGQGIYFDPSNSTVLWWCYRGVGQDYIANSSINWNTTAGQIYDPVYYDSPFDCGDAELSWTWSNFTWDNSSLSSGVIGWRIYYNDTSGNENVTSIATFRFLINLDLALWGNVAFLASLARGVESETLFFDEVTLSYSFSRTLENQRSFSEIVDPLISFNREVELSKLMVEETSTYSFMSRGLEKQSLFFETVNIIEGMFSSVVSALLDVSYFLFGNVLSFSSLESGKELLRSFSGEVNFLGGLGRGISLKNVLFNGVTLLDSLFTVTPIELSFLFFQSVQVLSGLISSTDATGYVLNDALLLACFACVLAFASIGLIFIVKRD